MEIVYVVVWLWAHLTPNVYVYQTLEKACHEAYDEGGRTHVFKAVLHKNGRLVMGSQITCKPCPQ